MHWPCFEVKQRKELYGHTMATLTPFEHSNSFTGPVAPPLPFAPPDGRFYVEQLARYAENLWTIGASGSETSFTDGIFELTFSVAPGGPSGLPGDVVTGFSIVQIATSKLVLEATGLSASAEAVVHAVIDQEQGLFPALLYSGGDLMAASQVLARSISFAGGLGNDTLIGGGAFNNLLGDEGADHLTGGNFGLGQVRNAGATGDSLDGGTGNDTILGFGGNDTIIGGAGADSISGGLDIDSVRGGDDDNIVFGGEGGDSIWGDAGNDTLFGEGGNDLLRGEAGNDSLDGGAGNDTMNAGEGRDRLVGGDGNDVLYGDAAGASAFGNDTLSGDAGADTLYGYDGADSLSGGDFNDALFGSAGNDRMVGGKGFDTLVGGTGADVFIFKSRDLGKDATDLIADFNPNAGDRIDLSGFRNVSFVGQAEFAVGAGGQVRYVVDSADYYVIQIDTDGNGAKNFELDVARVFLGDRALMASDFVF